MLGETAAGPQVCQERELPMVKIGINSTRPNQLHGVPSSLHALPESRKKNCNVIFLYQVIILVVFRTF